MPDRLVKATLIGLSWLPLSWVHALATGLGRLLLLIAPTRVLRVTRINLALCFPELSEQARERLVRESLLETAKTYAELGALWRWPLERVLGLVRDVSGEELLRESLEAGQGVILLTPHLGAWEMAGLYASARYPMTSLYRPSRHAGLEPWVRAARQRGGGSLVPTDARGLRALRQALARGDLAGILPDHEPSRSGKGLFADFLGVPAFTAALVPRLARQTGARVIFTYAERLPGGQGFHIHYLEAPGDILAENLAQAVKALNQGIEACVRRCPEQYQWSYKRFKTRPPGFPSVYGG